MNPRIEQLKQAVEKACGCKAQHARSSAVIEGFEGQRVWDGVVETFNLKSHPRAQKCYAFKFIEEAYAPAIRTHPVNPVIKTVLGVPPINSPEDAVRAAVAAQARQ